MTSSGLIVLIILLSVFALIPAVIAQSKGRPFWLWYLVSWLLFLPALVAALVIKPTDVAQRASLAEAGYRACPYCAEMIRSQTITCRYCGRDLPPGGVVPEPAEGWSPDADEATRRAWNQLEES